MRKIQPVILAGGSGLRLWPLSREFYPKQLLNLTGERSLLQNTLLRVAKLENALAPIVISAEPFKYGVQRQIEELGIFPEYSVVLEPLGRNTGPAVCGIAEYVYRRQDEDTVLFVLPSDHLIGDDEKFLAAVERGVELTAKGHIVTFGVSPEWAETGYGYIEAKEDGTVVSFKEKPGLELAEKYVARGNYYWNSGILAFTGKTFLAEMAVHSNHIYACMVEAVKNGKNERSFFRFDPESMSPVENISIDHALLEHTTCGKMVPLNVSWRDVGTWQACWQIMARDENGNVLQGEVTAKDTQNSLVIAKDRIVAALGLQDIVVVETAEAVLVSSMAMVQQVGELVSRMGKKCGRISRLESTVEKRWGTQTVLVAEPACRIRKLSVAPKAGLALEKHRRRNEYWIVEAGTARVTSGEEVFLLSENQSVTITAGVVHRLENPGSSNLEVLEIQLGGSLDEEDAVRYEGAYGMEKGIGEDK